MFQSRGRCLTWLGAAALLAAAIAAVSRPVNATPRVPDGFSAELVTADIHAPRVIRTAPNGDLFVADSMNNTVHVLRIPPGTAKPSVRQVFATGLFLPVGVAVGSDGSLFVTEDGNGTIWRVTYGGTSARAGNK
jgi:glucose/arabinose dehydrogenase